MWLKITWKFLCLLPNAQFCALALTLRFSTINISEERAFILSYLLSDFASIGMYVQKSWICCNSFLVAPSARPPNSSNPLFRLYFEIAPPQHMVIQTYFIHPVSRWSFHGGINVNIKYTHFLGDLTIPRYDFFQIVPGTFVSQVIHTCWIRFTFHTRDIWIWSLFKF